MTKLASGQVTHGVPCRCHHLGLPKAAARATGGEAVDDEDIIIHRLSQRKVKVQDLDFSPNDKFIATIGGQDTTTSPVVRRDRPLPLRHRRRTTRASSCASTTMTTTGSSREEATTSAYGTTARRRESSSLDVTMGQLQACTCPSPLRTMIRRPTSEP